MAEIVLFLLCALLAVVGLGVAAALRDRVPHGRAPAATFAAPGALLAGCVLVALLAGEPVAAVPLAAGACLFAAATWMVLPTRRSRFAQFETQFRAFAAQHDRRSRGRS